MIKREVFKTKMEEAKDLLGSTMKLSAFDRMYDRLSNFYVTKDFELAIDSIVESGEKLIYPVLVKAMNVYRERRVEAELRTEKAKTAKAIGSERGRGERADVSSIIADLEKRLKWERGEFPEIPYIKYNAVLVEEGGHKMNCYIPLIDTDGPRFDDLCRVEHEEAGGSIRRVVFLDTNNLKIVQRTERKEI